MDLTNTPEDVRTAGEESPDFDEWESPEAVLKEGSTRERMLDIIIQLREPQKVSTIAERGGCDTETARDYLEWFAEMGMVRATQGRPIRYQRNDSYLRWRRVEQLREQFSETELVDELTKVQEAINAYRSQFDAEDPGAVSLLEYDDGEEIAEVWNALSEWKTLEKRAELLDAARRDESGVRGRAVSTNG